MRFPILLLAAWCVLPGLASAGPQQRRAAAMNAERHATERHDAEAFALQQKQAEARRAELRRRSIR